MKSVEKAVTSFCDEMNRLLKLSVPDHQELAKGTLRAIIRDADLSVEEFIALL
ncbi:type II toxin-antitoxin system HicA family toxin [Nostoc sp. UHCC 0302]|uniref:type II toxin-antitoxin system HicA family toxin n=1 Tax=Nostoc sp. UHCC 0302 TaxID=3134896 RepID=UPI00311C8CC7